MADQSTNPPTVKVGQSFAELNGAQLVVATATTATCFERWRQTSFAQLAAISSKVATIMCERLEEFSRPMILEMGKLFAQAQGEARVFEHGSTGICEQVTHPRYRHRRGSLPLERLAQ